MDRNQDIIWRLLVEGWSFRLSPGPGGWEESLLGMVSGGTLEALKKVAPCTHTGTHTTVPMCTRSALAREAGGCLI